MNVIIFKDSFLVFCMKIDTIILAGGFGTRLAPITNSVPKQLLPVAGRPVLSYAIEDLNKFYSNVSGKCYLTVNSKFASHFKKFIENEDLNFPMEIIIEDSICEDQKPGFMGALMSTFKEYVGNGTDAVLILAGDSISSLDFNDLLDGYKLSGEGAVALYHLKNIEDAKNFGCAKLDEKGNVDSFVEKPSRPGEFFCEDKVLVNTTYQLISRDNMQKAAEIYYESHGDLLEALGIMGSKIKGVVFDGYWFDVGTHKSFSEANEFLSAR